MLTNRAQSSAVVCVTDGNFKGDGEARMSCCRSACEALGVDDFACLGFPDDPAGCLELDAVVAALQARYGQQPPTRVFTHSPHGEYGHFNHIDVSLAVHRAFPNHAQLYVVAAHLFPELRVHLDQPGFARKLEIALSHYTAEMRHSWQQMSNLVDEGYLRLPLAEVEAIHGLLMDGEPVDPSQVPHYRELLPLISPRS